MFLTGIGRAIVTGPTPSVPPPSPHPVADVDVLLPVYRARDTLPDAVGDLLGQRGVDLRVLAAVDVDADGRDDGSLAWLETRAADDPRLVVVRGPGAGVGPALDAALAVSDADLVGHMEADDRCPADRLARLLAGLAERPELDGLTSRVETFGAQAPGMERYVAWQNELLTGAEMARHRWIEIPAMHQSGVYKRVALDAIGGYTPRGEWPADIDVWLRWFGAGLTVAKLPDVLYRWRQHAEQHSRSSPLHTLDVLRAAKIHDLERELAGRLVVLTSTGATFEAWHDDLRRSTLMLAEAAPWKPNQEPPPRVVAAPPTGAVVVAAYGRAPARRAVRAALGRPHEPSELLFVA